jgi:hypothetical protein
MDRHAVRIWASLVRCILTLYLPLVLGRSQIARSNEVILYAQPKYVGDNVTITLNEDQKDKCGKLTST